MMMVLGLLTPIPSSSLLLVDYRRHLLANAQVVPAARDSVTNAPPLNDQQCKNLSDDKQTIFYTNQYF